MSRSVFSVPAGASFSLPLYSLAVPGGYLLVQFTGPDAASVTLQIVGNVSATTYWDAPPPAQVDALDSADTFLAITLTGTNVAGTLTIINTQAPPPPLSVLQDLVFNVRDYGAVGDGVTDDTAAIQAAVNAAAAVSGTCYLPRGRYVANGTIITPSQNTGFITIAGEGIGSTTLTATVAIPGATSLLTLGMPGIIRDLTIDAGGNLAGASNSNGLFVGNDLASAVWPFAGLYRVRVQNCSSNATWNLVVWMQGSSGLIDTLVLEDVTVAGPSSTASDAMAINSFGTCFVSRMVLTGLYRSPNFYQGNKLIVDGITIETSSTGAVAGVVFDAGVNVAIVRGLTFINGGSNVGAVIANAPLLLASGWDTPEDVWSTVSINQANNTQRAFFSNCRVGAGLVVNNTMDILQVTGGRAVCGAAGAVIAATPGITTGPIHLDGVELAAGAGNDIVVYSYTSASAQVSINGGVAEGIVAIAGGPGTTTAIVRNLTGINPVGALTVTVPASGSPTAALPYDTTFYITAGTSACACAVPDAAGTSQTVATIPSGGFGSVFVPAGSTLTPTYTSAPTWTVQGH